MANDMTQFRERKPKRTQLPEEVASYVRELILSGELRPGEFLRMEPIAEAVGVSNTPVREGLLTLRSEGFVELVPRRGFVVAAFTQQDVRDLFWAQAQLASELAARAAKTATTEQVASMENHVEQCEKFTAAQDMERMVEAGHAFHRELNKAADSHRLTLLLSSIVNQLPNSFYGAIDGHIEATREAHPLILEAIRKRAPRKAKTLMTDHILEGGERLIEMLEARGLWNGEESAS